MADQTDMPDGKVETSFRETPITTAEVLKKNYSKQISLDKTWHQGMFLSELAERNQPWFLLGMKKASPVNSNLVEIDGEF